MLRVLKASILQKLVATSNQEEGGDCGEDFYYPESFSTAYTDGPFLDIDTV